MRYLSLCSGIEAASQAWKPLGWSPVAFSEIEPFPCAVLAHRFPETPNLGDMTKYESWNIDATVDLLVGGTPCQSFSVAGLRKGLADPRGNLALTYLAIVNRYRPRWIVWENVPGVLSSISSIAPHPPQAPMDMEEEGQEMDTEDERDEVHAFNCFLAGLSELGYGWAYRILDAQYVRVQSHSRAVPQRRRRVFVVGYLGNWAAAAGALFERESLQGYPSPSRNKREDVAPCVRAGASNGGAGHGARSGDSKDDLICAEVSSCDAQNKVDRGDSQHCERLVAHSVSRRYDSTEDGTGRGTPLVSEIDSVPPLRCHKSGGHGADSDGMSSSSSLIPETIGFSWQKSSMSTTLDMSTTPAVAIPEVCGTLSDGAHQGGGSTDRTRTQDESSQSDVAWALQERDAKGPDSSTKDGHLIVQRGFFDDAKQVQWASGGGKIENDTAQALRSGAEHNYQFARVGYRVRRLSPIECERLMGMEDNWTLVPYNGKPAKDGPRYKALGNSMCRNVMSWIGSRIQMVEDIIKEDRK